MEDHDIRAARAIEFLDEEVSHETQYFGDPSDPGVSRAQWVEGMS